MRRLWSFCLAAGLGLALLSARAGASEGFEDISKLAKSGVAEEVLVAFVQASPVAYELTVEEILYLNDLGVASKSIQEIINHGRDLRAGKEPVVAQTDPVPNPVPPLAQDDYVPVPVDPATLGGLTVQTVTDPNAPDNAPVYVSPLTGEVSSTPEVYQSTEMVRDSVDVAVPVSETAECTTSHFYEALTPYGNWVSINGTWCWQPSVGASDPEWRPYGTRGHWVWTDSGWCWESDYSWGWAPFHYGRWWRAPGYGWMWTPDTVWAPAWVNWRQSESHWGWAPLPPAARYETNAAVGVGFHFGGRHWGSDVGVGFDFGLSQRDYCFVPQEHFCDRNVYSYFAPRDQVSVFYGRTTVIQNNITINRTTNNIYVAGPNSQLVQQRINRPLVQVRIEDNTIHAGARLGKGSSEDREHGVLRFYRPHVTAVAVETPREIAVRQEALVSAHTRTVTDPRALAASARADELRERHLATVDAHREVVQIRQSEAVEEATVRHADFETKRINSLMAKENNADRRAEFAAKLAAEKQRAEEARLQKLELEKQATEQRKHETLLAAERDRAARAKAETDADALRRAHEARARMTAERNERERTEREAAILRQKELEEQRKLAKINAVKPGNTPDINAAAAEADRKARLEADRKAREATRLAQEDLKKKQREQMEKDRLDRIEREKNKPVVTPQPTEPKRVVTPPTEPKNVNPPPTEPKNVNPPPTEPKKVVTPPVDPRNDPNRAAENKAAREAERLAREKAAADKAAALKAEHDAAKAEREKNKVVVPPPAKPPVVDPNNPATWPVNPRTGKQYDPNNPNDPNYPKNKPK